MKWNLLSEIRTLLKAGPHDKFEGRDHENALRGVLYSAWQSQLHSATQQISRLAASHIFYTPNASVEVPAVMSILKAHLSQGAIASAARTQARPAMRAVLDLGKAAVDAMYKKQTGKEPVTKADASFGILFGLTEDHAVQALTDQLTIAAGGFWDDKMSESIRSEMESWFIGDLTREELTQKLQTMVNERLSIEGESSLPASYFDGLTEHYIVRARNVGSVYRGKSLGAKEYKIANPRDERTSGICKTLSAPGMVFAMPGAEDKVEGILGARSQTELKAAAPFLTDKNAGGESAPVPPLHWRCRSWMQYVFEGL